MEVEAGAIMDVPMELSRIVINEQTDQQFIFLREKGGQRQFPIVIGTAEAYAIDRRLKRIPFPRPMTHDLLASAIQAMGGELERIVVSDLRDSTFIATLYVRRDGEVIEIDSRPSDAIALGVGLETPIFVAEHVMEAVDRQPTLDQQIGVLKMHLQVLDQQIEALQRRLSDDEFQKHRQRLGELRAEQEAVLAVLKKLS